MLILSEYINDSLPSSGVVHPQGTRERHRRVPPAGAFPAGLVRRALQREHDVRKRIQRAAVERWRAADDFRRYHPGGHLATTHFTLLVVTFPAYATCTIIVL